MNKKESYSFVLILLAFISSCNSKQERLKENVYGITPELLWDEMSFANDEQCLLKDYFMSSSFKNDSVNMFVGYNDKIHALDFFDLSNAKTYQCQLESEGPEGTARRICGIHFHNLDSIWVYDETMHVSLLNFNGEIKEKVFLKRDDIAEEIIIQTNYAMSTNKLFYNKDRKSLFFTLANYSDIMLPTFRVCELSLANHQIVKYDLSPSLVEPKLSSDYCNKRIPNVIFSDSLIIYNYPIESNVYTLNVYTGEKSIKGGRSRFTENAAAKAKGSLDDYATFERHDIENVHFQEVSYLPELQCYVRLHFGSADYIAGKSPMELFKQKEIYLMLFNERFEIINETRLPPRRYTHYTTWLPMTNGFLIFVNEMSTPEDEERTMVDIICGMRFEL